MELPVRVKKKEKTISCRSVVEARRAGWLADHRAQCLLVNSNSLRGFEASGGGPELPDGKEWAALPHHALPPSRIPGLEYDLRKNIHI